MTFHVSAELVWAVGGYLLGRLFETILYQLAKPVDPDEGGHLG